nr:unnamed protein product [Digitaria exilis]
MASRPPPFSRPRLADLARADLRRIPPPPPVSSLSRPASRRHHSSLRLLPPALVCSLLRQASWCRLLLQARPGGLRPLQRVPSLSLLVLPRCIFPLSATTSSRWCPHSLRPPVSFTNRRC